ncbi:MAG: polysaccharide biosynthesis protein [Paramuribaculum sp.]|nr:polysaccharide biosynthesis protein [Paramuribaculum sp.]
MEYINALPNHSITKNAIALTLRMMLITVVGLYTSRIVLKALGVDDYGIYGVIGGVVGMASFLNTAMAGATSRFITFELGSSNTDKLKKIFSTSLLIHIAIAIIVAILAETAGLWFVNNKMNFPADKMFAVNVLYQFSILSMMVSFTQVPYTAAIIAHERMSIYAYFEIINAILKLGIAYIILSINSERLIIYASLMLTVSIISAFMYRIYCIKHFVCTRFHFLIDKKLMREMLAYSGYDLYGNMCDIARTQSIPLLLNMFFGVVANAAASITGTVITAVSGFSMAIFQAFKPQIVKQYAAKDITAMKKTMQHALAFMILTFSTVAIPLFIFTKEIIHLWLGEVPLYSVEFLRLMLIGLIFTLIINVYNTAIHATGHIKQLSLITGSIYMLSPIVGYTILKNGFSNINTVYIVNIAVLIAGSAFSYRQHRFNISHSIHK